MRNAKQQSDIISRACGCLLGQLAGDSLGSLVEFQKPDTIRAKYPNGLRALADGGAWNIIAGQPTDDSEMALMLARMLIEKGRYDADEARRAYLYWLDSEPFDCGTTIYRSLHDEQNPDSQANGALMRISPLGIFGANHELNQVAEWARQDATITHVHPVCQQINALYAMAIAYSINSCCDRLELYARLKIWTKDMSVDDSVLRAINEAADSLPTEYLTRQGWVIIAFQNAIWQLLHAPNLEEGVVDTVMRGGDTDTNAAICGAFLGAIYGDQAIPQQWRASLLSCRPSFEDEKVKRPRPECFWPVDAIELAMKLVEAK